MKRCSWTHGQDISQFSPQQVLQLKFAQLVFVAFFSRVGVEHQDEVLHSRLQLGWHVFFFLISINELMAGKMERKKKQFRWTGVTFSGEDLPIKNIFSKKAFVLINQSRRMDILILIAYRLNGYLILRISRAFECRWWSVKICPFRHPRSCWRGVRVSFTPAGQRTDPPVPAGHTACKLDVGGGLRYIRLYINVSMRRIKSESCSGFIVQTPSLIIHSCFVSRHVRPSDSIISGAV